MNILTTHLTWRGVSNQAIPVWDPLRDIQTSYSRALFFAVVYNPFLSSGLECIVVVGGPLGCAYSARLYQVSNLDAVMWSILCCLFISCWYVVAGAKLGNAFSWPHYGRPVTRDWSFANVCRYRLLGWLEAKAFLLCSTAMPSRA